MKKPFNITFKINKNIESSSFKLFVISHKKLTTSISRIKYKSIFYVSLSKLTVGNFIIIIIDY